MRPRRRRLSAWSNALRAEMFTTVAAAPGSAPHRSRGAMADVRPAPAANMRGVWPHRGSRASGSAPCASSASTAAALPDCAAKCRGAAPADVRASPSA